MRSATAHQLLHSPITAGELQAIFREWALSPWQQLRLLGVDHSGKLDRYLARPEETIDEPDVLERALYLLDIHRGVGSTRHQQVRASEWLHEPNDDYPFQGLAPLDYLLDSDVDAWAVMRRRVMNEDCFR